MNSLRILSIVVFIVGLAGSVYYTVVNKEAQGAVVVLAAILYFVALPHITRSGS